MERKMSAEEVINILKLEPLLPEGGWFNRIWYRPGEISAIYYLLKKGDFSEFHVLPYQEHFFFLGGDPVELYRGRRDSSRLERTVLGSDIAGGEAPSLLVEAETIQGSRLIPGGSWALMSTVMNPPFEADIYRTCPREELLETFPDDRELIFSLTN